MDEVVALVDVSLTLSERIDPILADRKPSRSLVDNLLEDPPRTIVEGSGRYDDKVGVLIDWEWSSSADNQTNVDALDSELERDVVKHRIERARYGVEVIRSAY